MAHGHRFALYSVTGVHIGLWSDMRIAMDMQREYPDSYIEEMVMLSDHDAEITQLRAELARRVIAAEKLVEALQTARDYVSDSHIGALVYDDGKRVSETMTTEDLSMIGEAITAYEATK